MDLDLMTSFGGGGSGGGNTPGSLELYPGMNPDVSYISGAVYDLSFPLHNNSTNPIDMTPNSGATLGQNTTIISLNVDGINFNNVQWDGTSNPLVAGGRCDVDTHIILHANDTITVSITPQGGSTCTFSRTIPAIPPSGSGVILMP
jgi:archaellin